MKGDQSNEFSPGALDMKISKNCNIADMRIKLNAKRKLVMSRTGIKLQASLFS